MKTSNTAPKESCRASCERGCDSDKHIQRHSQLSRQRTGTSSLNRVMGYRLRPLIDRLVEKKGLNRSDANDLYADLMRFLYLCGTESKVLAPSERIDLAWHEFLLFTKEYQRFCQRMFGFFIHHNPRSKDDRPSRRVNSPIRNTLTAAWAVFGELSPNWDFPGALKVSDGNCASCDTPSTNCQTPD
jgi:hypothetical protein